MKITRADIQVDLERLRPFIREDPCFYAPAGREHYRLLAHLSSSISSGQTIFDIGTHRGDSAIALSYNERNQVESFDVIDAVPTVRKMRKNVRYNVEDLFDPMTREEWRSDLLESALIFIDIDPHEGTRELEFVSWLQEEKYQGIIVLDDIWYFKEMRDNLWSKIPSAFKRDLTEVGHWSGTGIVQFNDYIVETTKQHDNWTVVTGYFDLMERDDVNGAIRGRPSEHYIEQHSGGLLSLDRNLVVYCEKRDVDRIMKMRPGWLWPKTHVVETEFDSFPLSKHYEELKQTRVDGHCARDPRNTASYYLFCVARFAMLHQAIENNEFGSELFAWSNICIERMGFRNLIEFDRSLDVRRSKFSTAYIDYLPASTFSSLPSFFGKDGCRDPNGPCGRCSMCSGFFTGSSRYMSQVALHVENKFVECLESGYGHADEQLIALVHRDHPELFDWYPADYAQMLTNYAAVNENAEGSVRNLVRKSFEASDWAVCARASGLILKSYFEGRCELSDVDLSFLMAAKATSDAGLL